MDEMLLVFLPFFGFFLIFFLCAMRRVPCPECGTILPNFYPPSQKTRRMWKSGGYICPNCGCEANARGEKIDPDSVPEEFAQRKIVWLTLASLAGALLVAGIMFLQPFQDAPPPPLPVVEAPLPAPQ
ncbi:hypothetical protein KIH39_01485 [Telmatocola sphagniphila]|uniref:Uncharacterized protein n=1 Tax=Telmatocola sphagniphila TaxID=1123043 RepID=A0A8E6EVH6_9BACT|nr:transposase [Telmatocola sphagniphila]QVL32617.1 hypothetical protein KIH39_01485 [Telmatocola sphagniphila]